MATAPPPSREKTTVAAPPDDGSMATEAFSIAALPDDGLATVLGVLPPRSLAVARCVWKAWRDVIDARALLLPHLLPGSVRGIFINYVHYNRPCLFARPVPSSTFPAIDGVLGFLPNEPEHEWWTILEHCNGLLLCNVVCKSRLLVCNPATQRWTLLPGEHMAFESCAYLAFDPTVSPQYEVFLIPDVPVKPPEGVAYPFRQLERWRGEIIILARLRSSLNSLVSK